MRSRTKLKLIAFLVTGTQLLYAPPVLAATAGVSNVENLLDQLSRFLLD